MRLLFFSQNADDRVFFEAICQEINLPFIPVASLVELCDEINETPSSIVLVDVTEAKQFQAFEATVSEKIGLFSANLNTNNLFFIAEEPIYLLPYLTSSDLFGHYIERTFTVENKFQVGRMLSVAAAMAVSANGQLADRGIGLEAYLDKGAKVQSVKIKKSGQKKAVIDGLKNELVRLGYKTRIADVISTAADELLMNAIFDAPVDEMGKQIYAQTARSSDFDLAGKNEVELKVGFDGKILGVSVIDNHGSLDKRKLLNQHLAKSYKSSDYEMRPIAAGAGLGLSHVYRNCGGMVFVCEAGSKTEVMLFFKKTDSFKEFKDQFRFFSTFMYFL